MTVKVVNVSKSQYYEFKHNIINLGNQKSKISWRIRDLENTASYCIIWRTYFDCNLNTKTVLKV